MYRMIYLKYYTYLIFIFKREYIKCNSKVGTLKCVFINFCVLNLCSFLDSYFSICLFMKQKNKNFSNGMQIDISLGQLSNKP